MEAQTRSRPSCQLCACPTSTNPRRIQQNVALGAAVTVSGDAHAVVQNTVAGAELQIMRAWHLQVRKFFRVLWIACRR